MPSTLNVFWGDMSLVGNYSPSLPGFLKYSIMYRKCLSVKPGIFGYWQLNQSEKVLLMKMNDVKWNWNILQTGNWVWI